MDYNTTNENSDITWDFRQFYVEWVGYYLKQYTEHDLNNNFPAMFRIIRKIHPIIWGRTRDSKSKDRSVDEEFNTLITEITKIANNDPKTYVGQKRDPEAMELLSNKFNSAMEHIVWLMKKNKMFGSEAVNRGL